MARRYYSSTAARTTLASGVDGSATTLSVTAVSGWPTQYPYTLVLDQDTINEELVEVTGRTGTTVTVTRGVDGTSATSHDAGAVVQHGVSARDFDEPNEHVNTSSAVHGLSGDVVGTTDTQTLTNKTLSNATISGTITGDITMTSGTITGATEISVSGNQTLADFRARNVYAATTTPTGGNDGDLWVQYNA